VNTEKFDFEKLKVFQKALEYFDFVYEATKHFPKSKAFALINQFKRTSLSVCLNIAEGSGGSKKEFNQFLKLVRRSAKECIAITEIVNIETFIGSPTKRQSRNYCSGLSRMRNGLTKLLKKVNING
jgi:four helix bundle protein